MKTHVGSADRAVRIVPGFALPMLSAACSLFKVDTCALDRQP